MLVMSHLYRTSFHQNPNIGLYGFANNQVCLLGNDATATQVDEIHKALKVPVHKLSLYHSSLIGAFVAGNNKCILIPSIIDDDEIAILNKLGIKHHILNTDFNALGNNMIANDHACIISPVLEPWKDEIKVALGVKHIEINPIENIPTIGSLAALNDKGCLLSAFATPEQAAWVQELLEVPVTRGTINLGSPFVGAGIITNTHGFIFGERTGGPEAVAADEALGFLRQ